MKIEVMALICAIHICAITRRKALSPLVVCVTPPAPGDISYAT